MQWLCRITCTRFSYHLPTNLREGNVYRPQTKFAKVMFLHLYVSHSIHRGVFASVHAGIHSPGADTPRADTPLCSACWEIWATNRQYPSYWNAYLFHMRVPVHRGEDVVCLVPGPFWWICLVHPLGRYTPSPGRYILWY